MRKLKLQVQISVDGYICGPNGEMDWLEHNWDDQLKKYVTLLTEPVDTIILGRKLAEGFIPHWAANPKMEGADKFNGAPKVVFTKTLTTCPWANTRLAKGDLKEEILKLKNENGGDLIAYGGASFDASLIEAGLIDELHLFLNPAALGQGMPIFRGRTHLVLDKSQTFPCGIQVLCYKPLKKNKENEMSDLIINRVFDAPRDLVWKAWSECEGMKRWWGPKNFTAPACRIDFKVGGSYLLCMRSPEGQDFWNTGIYKEIVPKDRIVYTDSFSDEKGNVVPASHYGMGDSFPLELTVTILLEDLYGKTKMTLRHAGLPKGEMSDMTGAGWNESFDKLAESLMGHN